VSSGSVAESESELYGTPQNWDERQDEIASDHESNEPSDTARFNVLITGTLFPLGPSQDAVHVLTSMGGPIGDAGKWKINPELRRALVRIFDPTPAPKLRRGPEKIK
jgi:hypothetical protein